MINRSANQESLDLSADEKAQIKRTSPVNFRRLKLREFPSINYWLRRFRGTRDGSSADGIRARDHEDRAMQRSGEDITSKRLVPVLDSKDTANRSSDGRTARCIRFLALHVLTLCLIVLGTSAAVAAGEQDAVGRIVRQQGPVTGLRDAEPRSLYVGAPVYRGDRIITGADAKVEIEFRDGSTLSIGSGTEVEVTQFRPDARERGRFTLLIGIIRASLADSWTDGFEVWTRAAIASVRSTDWVTEAQENRSSVFVVAGQVEVTGAADGSRVLLAAEFGTDVEIGGAPSPPKRWGGSRVADVLARTRLP